MRSSHADAAIVRGPVGEVGIVKHFGAIDLDHPDVFDPGIHLKVPFRDDVVIFETRIVGDAVAVRRSRSLPTASIRFQRSSTLSEMVTSLTG